MKKLKTLKQLHENYLVAVVRGKSKDDAIAAVQQMIEGGIHNIEITFTTPQAEEVIRHLSETSDGHIVIGAGTVLDSATARIAILNGAKYIVSPHLDLDIAKMCNRYAVPYLPGCGSVTEIVQAMEVGVDLVKLFPGDLLGANFIKNVHGPIPHIELMPSGGVSLDNLEDWYKKGAYAVGIGSALMKNAKDGNDAVIKDNTEKFVRQFETISG
ncbi:bifunctional 2-keto-4-hydroxyglutarate aldolase/2-keto-3-deoxy-6-phosphogluconate aldolase [Staphylococcus sp. NRL 16/872]|uniref:bifunctional 2-keto-4-hydroxyglutarate aldolase/2-keto-3-deoxy-6-phosphogluconate aldolase n=1 Tax=Staphylococcus sp. NRL 16/872 TaxID=2930131 RepID=UPI001FB2780C|nr:MULTISPECIES: bifunctional 2-keto-4-hydroxyglutarate aldolase/2-keto-3-deoxy-6-phosphogluconate aldolase [unclassified Staphylococcus]MCJ1662969.1 bifunctional 2-keto-4-hydroxyglutarate aldolase/2-keto-3-deoxy-6-phosphogluconate aldolase [Staphylococcus sp. NRL 18/288]MCJ1669095.1 bifunctional 2-keto-4-hydroxyglutarate aldolase/2-keto-3-deoxy-6-phosphogluconate aldolase [Staphylococcus sp. NRL 19/737]WEN69318.1 bifunctional 2-keto-4-hydroxyglutarate aldolase/2-keto-3-deoxy-6-phosphogluconate 